MRSVEDIHTDILAAQKTADRMELARLDEELAALNSPDASRLRFHIQAFLALQDGEPEAALAAYERQRELSEQLSQLSKVASVCMNIGSVYLSMGDAKTAFQEYHRALSLYHDLNDRAGVASATGNIGLIYHNHGDLASALEHYQKAVDIHEELGEPQRIALGKGNIGNVYHASEDFEKALAYHNEALELHRAVDDLDGVARVTGNRGNDYARMDNEQGAYEEYVISRDTYEQIHSAQGVAVLTGRIIASLLQLERFDEAAAELERMDAMKIYDPRIRNDLEMNRSELQIIAGELELAERTLKGALATAEEHELLGEQMSVHQRLRSLYERTMDLAGYIKHNEAFTRIREQLSGQEATRQLVLKEAAAEMQKEQIEGEKRRALIYATLPRDIADRMLRGEDVRGDHHKRAAVLTMDIVGFTSHSSRMSPNEVTGMLNMLYEQFDAICHTNGVTKIKTIGDSYVAVAFEKTSDGDATDEQQSQDPVLRLATTAVSMMRLQTQWADGSPLQFRMGLSVGPVVAGVIGAERVQYDVWGDTVKVASRLESTGEPEKIQVCHAFAGELRTVDGRPPMYALTKRENASPPDSNQHDTYWLHTA